MRPLTMCIVDDDRDLAQSLALLMQIEGHEVTLAFNGEEAVRLMRDRDFDLILMDVRLPGMNGVESLSAIRRLKPTAKVLMMTAYSVEQLVQQAIDAGAIGVLQKPFRDEELLRLL